MSDSARGSPLGANEGLGPMNQTDVLAEKINSLANVLAERISSIKTSIGWIQWAGAIASAIIVAGGLYLVPKVNEIDKNTALTQQRLDRDLRDLQAEVARQFEAMTEVMEGNFAGLSGQVQAIQTSVDTLFVRLDKMQKGELQLPPELAPQHSPSRLDAPAMVSGGAGKTTPLAPVPTPAALPKKPPLEPFFEGDRGLLESLLEEDSGLATKKNSP